MIFHKGLSNNIPSLEIQKYFHLKCLSYTHPCSSHSSILEQNNSSTASRIKFPCGISWGGLQQLQNTSKNCFNISQVKYIIRITKFTGQSVTRKSKYNLWFIFAYRTQNQESSQLATRLNVNCSHCWFQLPDLLKKFFRGCFKYRI